MTRTPYPHQIAAAKFLETPAGTLLAADPGTGKTLSSIMAARALGAKRILVVTPAILLSNWIREFALAGSELTVVDARRCPKRVKDADVLVVSVDWMRTDACKAITDGAWDALVVDECHTLSEPTTQRTLATYRKEIRAGSVMLLSGTPASKHAGQLWPHIARTAHHRIDGMDYETFTKTYCVVQMKLFGSMQRAQRVVTGNNPAMVPDLRARLKGWWLRQKKEDVLKDLPAKVVNEVRVSARKLDLAAIEAEVDPEIMEHLRFAMETGEIGGLSAVSDEVSRLRRLLAMAKAPAAADYIAGMVEMHASPVSAWGWHTAGLKDVERRLREKKLRTGLIDGSTPQAERDRIVDDFQAGKLDVFIGQIRAAGVGITLTRGYRAIMMEGSFNPAEVVQAVDRHHRIGQKDLVLVDWLILEDSIDEALMAIVQRRVAEWEALSKDA